MYLEPASASVIVTGPTPVMEPLIVELPLGTVPLSTKQEQPLGKLDGLAVDVSVYVDDPDFETEYPAPQSRWQVS